MRRRGTRRARHRGRRQAHQLLHGASRRHRQRAQHPATGRGILTALPHKLLARFARTVFARTLPEPGRYGVGNVFLPHDPAERRACKERIEAIVAAQGQECLGWRALPHDPQGADLGRTALAAMPHMEQLFIGAGEGCAGERFERALYVIRKYASRCLRGDEGLAERGLLYFCSLSSKVVVYKGC